MVLPQRHRIVPFAVCASAGLGTLALPPYDELSHVGALLLAVGLLAVCVVIAAVADWVSRWQTVPPLLFFAVVALILDGSGGSSSGLAPLVILPILWIALYRSRLELVLSAIATGLVFVLPLVIVGSPDYSWQTGDALCCGSSWPP